MIDFEARKLLLTEVERDGGLRVTTEKTITHAVDDIILTVAQARVLEGMGAPVEDVADALSQSLVDIATALLVAGAIIEETFPGQIDQLIRDETSALYDGVITEAESFLTDEDTIPLDEKDTPDEG